MKELSIEEKAKAYDEAIDKVAHFIKKHIGFGCMIHPNSSEAKELFNIFPELKESEDERIRGAIIDHLKDNNLTEWAAWLEKQKEQKPVKFDFLNDFGFAENGYDPMNVLMTIKRKWPMVWEKMLYQEQKPVEWSEEDASLLNTTILYLENTKDSCATACVLYINKCIDWLKSLRLQNMWKPNDLPHWKKSTLPNDNTTGFNSDYFCYKGYNINYKELFEKLPKDV